jgi:hypothetical protein
MVSYSNLKIANCFYHMLGNIYNGKIKYKDTGSCMMKNYGLNCTDCRRLDEITLKLNYKQRLA